MTDLASLIIKCCRLLKRQRRRKRKKGAEEGRSQRAARERNQLNQTETMRSHCSQACCVEHHGEDIIRGRRWQKKEKAPFGIKHACFFFLAPGIMWGSRSDVSPQPPTASLTDDITRNPWMNQPLHLLTAGAYRRRSVSRTWEIKFR